jgi:hypothetical protein
VTTKKRKPSKRRTSTPVHGEPREPAAVRSEPSGVYVRVPLTAEQLQIVADAWDIVGRILTVRPRVERELRRLVPKK